MTLAHGLRQLLWRDEVDRLIRELADQEAVERAAREGDSVTGAETVTRIMVELDGG